MNEAKRKPRETTAAQLPSDLVQTALVVAKYRRCTVAELFEGIARGPLSEMEREMAAEINRKQAPKPARKG